jgi:hypothetical protein
VAALVVPKLGFRLALLDPLCFLLGGGGSGAPFSNDKTLVLVAVDVVLLNWGRMGLDRSIESVSSDVYGNVDVFVV